MFTVEQPTSSLFVPNFSVNLQKTPQLYQTFIRKDVLRFHENLKFHAARGLKIQFCMKGAPGGAENHCEHVNTLFCSFSIRKINKLLPFLLFSVGRKQSSNRNWKTLCNELIHACSSLSPLRIKFHGKTSLTALISNRKVSVNRICYGWTCETRWMHHFDWTLRQIVNFDDLCSYSQCF